MMSITTTLALVSVIGAGAFFLAGLFAGARRRGEGGGDEAASRLRDEMEDQHRRARERLEAQLDEARESLASAEARLAQGGEQGGEAGRADDEDELTADDDEATKVGGEDLAYQLAEALEREEELSRDRDRLSAERTELADKIEELRAQQRKLAGEVDGRRQREKRLTGELGELRQRTKRLTGEAEALRSKLGDAEHSMHKSSAMRGEMRNEASDLRNEVASLRQQISDLRGERIQLDKDLEKALEQRDRALTELEQK